MLKKGTEVKINRTLLEGKVLKRRFVDLPDLPPPEDPDAEPADDTGSSPEAIAVKERRLALEAAGGDADALDEGAGDHDYVEYCVQFTDHDGEVKERWFRDDLITDKAAQEDVHATEQPAAERVPLSTAAKKGAK